MSKFITFVSFKEHLGKQAMDLEKISVKHKSDKGLVFRTYKNFLYNNKNNNTIIRR